MIGFDFLLHAGVLARLYVEPHPFLLPPMQAFRLIPLGYLSFLLLAVLIAWMMRGFAVIGFRNGAVFGLKLGGLIWASLVLGLASVSSASYPLLVGWFVGQTLEAGIAGAVMGAVFGGSKVRMVFAGVIGFMIACVVLAVVLQVAGFAPAVSLEAS